METATASTTQGNSQASNFVYPTLSVVLYYCCSH